MEISPNDVETQPEVHGNGSMKDVHDSVGNILEIFHIFALRSTASIPTEF
jgi:hypothetical protein